MKAPSKRQFWPVRARANDMLGTDEDGDDTDHGGFFFQLIFSSFCSERMRHGILLSGKRRGYSV